jgi:hypothetical protein
VDTHPDEEAIKQGLDSINEEAQAAEAETTRTGTTNIATFANNKGIDKRNAGKESRKTNLAEMLKDKLTGQRSTSWTRMPKQNPSTPLITMKIKTRMMTKKYSTQPEFILIESISQEP